MDRQVSRRGAGQNKAAIGAGLVIQFRESGAIADQAAGSGKGSPLEDRGKAVAERQGGKSDACAEEKLIVGDDEATRSRLGEFSKDIAKITCRTRADKLCLHADFLSRAEYVVRTCVLIGILRIEKQAEYWRIWSGGVQQLESLLFPPNRAATSSGDRPPLGQTLRGCRIAAEQPYANCKEPLVAFAVYQSSKLRFAPHVKPASLPRRPSLA